MPATSGRGRLVLVVDDERPVLRFTTGMLAQLGFDVIAVADGAEAVDVFRRRRDDIVLVVLDVTMPGMDGGDVLSQLERDPGAVPIVLTSGFDSSEMEERFTGRNISGFLQKPYRLDEMRTALRNALSGSPGPDD